MTDEKDFKWQVTCDDEGAVTVTFGPQLSELPIDGDVKLHAVGKSLINIGTQLMSSSISEDEDEDDYLNEDED